jgi:tripartite-type tricarboxylate transporter receptor subunit TctC
VLSTLHAALGRAMATPALRQQLVSLGIEPAFGTPEEFSALIRAELPKWADIVKRSGATAD